MDKLEKSNKLNNVGVSRRKFLDIAKNTALLCLLEQFKILKVLEANEIKNEKLELFIKNIQDITYSLYNSLIGEKLKTNDVFIETYKSCFLIYEISKKLQIPYSFPVPPVSNFSQLNFISIKTLEDYIYSMKSALEFFFNANGYFFQLGFIHDPKTKSIKPLIFLNKITEKFPSVNLQKYFQGRKDFTPPNFEVKVNKLGDSIIKNYLEYKKF